VLVELRAILTGAGQELAKPAEKSFEKEGEILDLERASCSGADIVWKGNAGFSDEPGASELITCEGVQGASGCR
jgi:hypothetical protein